MSLKLRLSIMAVLLPLFAGTGYQLYVGEQGNFHSITPGEAYRSAQLDRDELEHYIRKYGIRSILNLRGEDPNASWYREEIKVSTEENVMHYDLRLSAFREPSEESVRKLLKVLEYAPRPILIHCQGGADRSGLVAAMWKVVIDKERKSEARKQLSISFGHLPIGRTSVLDRFLRGWKPPH
jgi:protein tyrosine/serine phosphatase